MVNEPDAVMVWIQLPFDWLTVPPAPGSTPRSWPVCSVPPLSTIELEFDAWLSVRVPPLLTVMLGVDVGEVMSESLAPLVIAVAPEYALFTRSNSTVPPDPADEATLTPPPPVMVPPMRRTLPAPEVSKVEVELMVMLPLRLTAPGTRVWA